MKIGVVVAADMTIKAFLVDQLRALSEHYDVTVVANTTEPDLLRRRAIAIDVTPIPIERKISIRRDLTALLGLVRLFRKQRFAAVHSVTPKAGLLAMVAGLVAGVPVRIHMFTGQVWATRSGLSRALFKGADRLLAAAATDILADSPSQRDFLIAEGVVARERISVLGDGSICGVDLQRFKPDPEARQMIRNELGVPSDAVVFLFLGRLNREKGVLDLAKAFAICAAQCSQAFLVVAGPDEENLTPALTEIVAAVAQRVRFTGFTAVPERFMAAADVFCLPSYREGFGSVVVEAAGVGIPTVASRIYGLIDALEDGVTGLLHEPRNAAQIAHAMTTLATDAALRGSLGARARERASARFSKARLTKEVLDFYTRVLPSATRAP